MQRTSGIRTSNAESEDRIPDGKHADKRCISLSVLESMTVREAVIDLGFVERGEVTLEQLDSALDVLRMTAPGL